jgi:hypothetical protein
MKWTLEYVFDLEIWRFNQVREELRKYYERRNRAEEGMVV